MNTKDLRIGNFIESTLPLSENKIVCVAVLNLDNTLRVLTTEEEIKGCYRTILFNPISLTENLLLHFGFEKMIVESYPIFLLGDFMIEFYELESVFNYNNIELMKIKHVHQLQNLYFALTGEELTFKK